ncbi:MAG: ATP-binding protein [Verrucomicrobiota bacterium]|jgi:signal transduction histidine kinase/DNA-binding NarL/FixJ family response regulator
MNTVVVIAPQPELAAAVRAALDPSFYRLIQQSELSEDEMRLSAFSIDACICEADLTTVEPIRVIKHVRRILPNCPLILYASAPGQPWEEEAYILGVSQVLAKPVRGPLLNAVLGRLLADKAALEHPPADPPHRAEARPAAEASQGPSPTLELLRNYSSILLHDLNVESLLKEFLMSLRKIIGVNRAAIFLRQPGGSLADTPEPVGARRLHSACAIGLAAGLLEHFELSLESGIGGHLFRHGRILRCDSLEAERDSQMRKEFDLLSAQVAIPVLDRESLVGVAVFDGHVTGENLSKEELQLVFHLLEQLGQSVKNIWLHDQIASDHDLMSDILHQFSSGCVVVGRDLTVLHANEMARNCFPRSGRAPWAMEFSDLPQAIGSRVFEVLRTGATMPGYRYQPPGQPEKRYLITATPFKKRQSVVPNAVLLTIEDCSQTDRLRQLEVETANLRLVQEMAERLAHEIGNAVLPISTHQQLLKERIDDPDFQQSLAEALQEGVKRVSRLVSQMRYLARDRMELVEPVSVKQLIEEAFREARSYHPASTVLLHFESNEMLTVACDRVGLQHAFAEIILNALQANTQSCQVRVRSRSETDASGSRWARIEVQDSGAGFSAEAADKASRPFFTTRNVGLGLGLAVTNKIIQTHSGKMEIPPPQDGQPGLVRISLPLAPIPSLPHN